MAELIANCPRCGSNKITFDISGEIAINVNGNILYEIFCICRHCRCSTVFSVEAVSKNVDDHFRNNGIASLTGTINQYIEIDKYISIADMNTVSPPEHLPEHINAAFKEGAKCFAIGCYNAAASMFRLCLDMATNEFLPENDAEKPNAKIQRSLGFRLDWLFDNNYLPINMRELSICVKEDGNDGAHQGTLKKSDGENILDFTTILLERLYTEPKRLDLAKERREQRRT